MSTVVRVRDNKILRRYRVWDRPRGLVFSPDGKWFFQCHFGGPGVKEGMGMAFLRSKDGHLKRFVNDREKMLAMLQSPVMASTCMLRIQAQIGSYR